MEIGATIRAIRKRKEITIPQLCASTGLSKGFISNVENDKTSPSIATLESIAQALGVPLPYLLLRKEERLQVTRKDERVHTTMGHQQWAVEQLGRQGGLTLNIVEIPPGGATGFHAHEGEECHLILEGRIRVEQGEDFGELHEGDSFSWSASTPHTVTNIGDKPARVLIAVYREARP